MAIVEHADTLVNRRFDADEAARQARWDEDTEDRLPTPKQQVGGIRHDLLQARSYLTAALDLMRRHPPHDPLDRKHNALAVETLDCVKQHLAAALSDTGDLYGAM